MKEETKKAIQKLINSKEFKKATKEEQQQMLIALKYSLESKKEQTKQVNSTINEVEFRR